MNDNGISSQNSFSSRHSVDTTPKTGTTGIHMQIQFAIPEKTFIHAALPDSGFHRKDALTL
jgi:hypothetical protein